MSRIWFPWPIVGLCFALSCQSVGKKEDSPDETGETAGSTDIDTGTEKSTQSDTGQDESTASDPNDTEVEPSGVVLTVNPYAGVHWESYHQYKANFHTHTTQSDGKQDPPEVIDEYHGAGYEILAITDHNKTTWPWTDYGRDPDDLNMLAVRGNEYSNSHHMNAFFSFTTAKSGLETGLPHVQSEGGLAMINHPGRYNTPSQWQWYISWFSEYSASFGLEVFNKKDIYPDDRQIWDNINENLFQAHGKLAWGLANDDKHDKAQLFLSFQFMLMPELTHDALRQAMLEGAFYFAYEPGGSGQAKVPRIQKIIVDNGAKTITIAATSYDEIVWIGPGTNTVGTGETFDYSSYEDAPFVRAVLHGLNGSSYIQPFGFITY